MIYSDNTYDITNNIATYARRDFKTVFDTASNKWYMLNNLDEYEEYGIYGDSFDTYYPGKLVIVNDREYEWNGTQWVDLGQYIQRINGWTNDTASNFSIKYNGSNYVLKATQNDVEFTIFCLQNVPSSQSISFFSSASQGDLYEYELFYAGSVAKMIYDLGNSRSRRINVNYTWNANTEYVVRGTNGNYLDTTSNMKLFINGALLGSKSRSTYDNASDKIGMGYQSAYKYNKEFKIYESTGLLFDIKCKEDNGQYVLYDALGNGDLYNYGTEDPVVVTPIMTSQRPKDYVAKTAPTISTLWASTIYRNSAHLTTLMRNGAEMVKIDYMSDDILKKGEALIIDYLCFEAKAANSTVKITLVGTPTYSADFEYSLDGKNWITYSIGNTITLPNINDKVYMRGDNIATAESSNIRKQLNTTGNLKLSGDLRSLLSKNNFFTLNILPDNAFFNFMRDCTTITDAHELKLSATSIGGNAYCNLFKNCTNLVYGPASIDATIFTGVDACSQMFLGCTSLVETPILRGEILNNGSYYALCDGCTSLRKVTAYCTNISANLSTHLWLRNVAATGDFYNLGGATYPTGTSGIPSGWTIHTSL